MLLRSLVTVLLVVLLVGSGATFAQTLKPVGTITGTVDGEPFELVVSEGEMEGVIVSNAYWNSWMTDVLDVTIIGQSRPSLFSFTPGAMLIDFTLTGLAGPCPCEVTSTSLFYSPEGGFTSNVYDDLEATATVGSIEELEPGVYRITGTFSGVLGLKVGIMDRPDPERTVTIEGSFTVERLAEEEEMP
jgi:hypothetical protein